MGLLRLVNHLPKGIRCRLLVHRDCQHRMGRHPGWYQTSKGSWYLYP